MLSHLELAQLSKQIYFRDGGFVPGWKCDDYYCDDQGLAVGVYANNKNDMVIAFRGTDTGNVDNFLKNIVTDLYILFGQIPNTQSAAKEFVRRTRESRSLFGRFFDYLYGGKSNQLYLTGHSLGGMIAQLVGFECLKQGKDYQIVTFENPGIAHLIHPKDFSDHKEKTKKNFLTYVVDPNLFNTLKPHIGTMRHIHLKPYKSTFFSKGSYYLKNITDCVVNDFLRISLLLLLLNYFIDMLFGENFISNNMQNMAKVLLTYLQEQKYISPINMDNENNEFLPMFLMSLLMIVVYNTISELAAKTMHQHTLDSMINHFHAGKGLPANYSEISQWPSCTQYTLAQAGHLLNWVNPYKHKSLLTAARLDVMREKQIQNMSGYKKSS